MTFPVIRSLLRWVSGAHSVVFQYVRSENEVLAHRADRFGSCLATRHPRHLITCPRITQIHTDTITVIPFEALRVLFHGSEHKPR